MPTEANCVTDISHRSYRLGIWEACHTLALVVGGREPPDIARLTERFYGVALGAAAEVELSSSNTAT